MASQSMADGNQGGYCFGSSEIADLTAAQGPSLAQPGQAGETGRAPTDEISQAFLVEAVSGRNLFDDIAMAAVWNPGESLFYAWQDKVAGALATAYVVYLHLLNGDDKILGAVLNHPQFPKRRRIHRKNRALVALQLVAKPSDDAQFKAASDYAAILRCAALQQIRPDEFPERMSKVSLKHCRQLLREGQRRSRMSVELGDLPVKSNDQPDTEVPARERSEPPPTSYEPVAAHPLPLFATAIPADGRVQSLSESQMTVTVIGKGDRSKALTCELSAETVEALLSSPWEESEYCDVLDLLSTLAQIVDNTAGTSIDHAPLNPPPQTVSPTQGE